MDREAMHETTARDHRERILRVLQYMDEHVAEDLSLERLAAVAHLSRYHFHRVFKTFTGVTAAAYVRRRRLLLAAARLADTDDGVLDVALDSGFGSHEAFTRAFGTMFGLTPSAWRAQGATAPYLAPVLDLQPTTQGGTAMDMDVRNVEAMRVACVRHVGPYINCEPAWEMLCAWGIRAGVFGPDTVFLGIAWDDPESTPPEAIRYDACCTIPDHVEPGEGVDVRRVGGGPHATCTQIGPFQGLEETYRGLYAAVLDRGLSLAEAPCFEIYRTDPKTTPPEKLVTELYLPLER